MPESGEGGNSGSNTDKTKPGDTGDGKYEETTPSEPTSDDPTAAEPTEDDTAEAS